MPNTPMITVLLIEAEEEFLQQLRLLLKERYRISWVKEGRKALRKATQTIPDIILIDQRMSHSHCRELCRSLKKGQLTSHIPIILMIDVKATPAAFSDYRADAFLPFPFTDKILFVCLRRAIGLKIRLQKRYTMFYTEDNLYKREDVFLGRCIDNLG